MNSVPQNHASAAEIARGERFAFGANWRSFARHVDDRRVAEAERSLKERFGADGFSGRTFLDAGCGSGLFSLAARRLGATVVGFDYDPESAAAARSLLDRFRPNDPDWRILSGSALDAPFISGLGQFDLVYCWGVLHHTGDLWAGASHVLQAVRPGGLICLAIYNDQGWLSRYWTAVKRLYIRLSWLRWPLLLAYAPYFVGLRAVVIWLRGGSRGTARGMLLWHDLVDWLGGWPFEVARPAAVLDFARARGFSPVQVVTVGRRNGCNEFVLRRGS
jgi:2-polyprenyl-6-hydroxyphenyl methylase/3-demethylubiquinone-9 3-methyltransferase